MRPLLQPVAPSIDDPIELLQAWSGWRHGDLGDLAADLLGIAVVLLIWRSVRPAASQPRS